MSSRKTGFHALKIFNWKQPTKSSVTASLLDDAHHEIELSGYNRAPSPGSESPSGLLDMESSRVETIDDLDLFCEKLYSYYCGKGLRCIIIKWVGELLCLAFTICFSAFFLLFVDWDGLRHAKCGMDAVESGIRPCDLSKEALNQHPLTPFTISKAIIVGYLGIFSIYWVFCFFRFFAQLKETLKIRRFYNNSLFVTDNEIQTMPWSMILEKVVQVQHRQQLSVVKDLSVHDVVMRLMRKENYLIGMLNKGVLACPVSQWLPIAGITCNASPDGVQQRLVLPKILEWTLNWCILQSMFDRNFCIRRDFVSDPETLRKRLKIVGFILFLLSPFLVIFMLVYLFLRHAEQFYHHPSTASSRRWSNLSKWMFREFNEVDHLFKHRMNSSVAHASDYLKQFPSPIVTILAKFISFVSGGFAAVLIIIAFLEESLLEGHIFGRNLFWYAAVFGTITAISRAAVADELLVLDPQGMMSQVVQHTHFMPKRWRGKEHTETVRKEFETLFQYTGMMLLEEMASIFVTPYLLVFVVPKRVDSILQFIVDFTVDVEGVGHVCSFSLFDFKNCGNRRYGSPFESPRSQRSSQGKMEKSFLSFHITYPSWEPDADGKQFLRSLKIFRDHKLSGRGMLTADISSLMQHHNLRGVTSRNGLLPRALPFRSTGNMSQSDSLWLIDGQQRNFPYILDWYYTSEDHEGTSEARDNDEDKPEDSSQFPPISRRKEMDNMDDIWDDDLFADPSQSRVQGSTFTPLFEESVLRQQEPSEEARLIARGRWWARQRPDACDQQQASFLEPPNFASTSHQHTSFVVPPTMYNSNAVHDHMSERSMEDSGHLGQRGSRRLSRSFYMEDLEAGDFNPPFVDVYRSPSGSISENAAD